MNQQIILKGRLIVNGVDSGYQFLDWEDSYVKNFWSFENLFPENYFTFQVGKTLATYIKLNSNDKRTLLDYSSGLGFLIENLLEYGFQSTAVEFSENSISRINNRINNNPLFRGAHFIDEIINANEKYDIVTLIEVLEHLDDKYLKSTFDNIKRILKPNGKLFITTPNDEDLLKSLVLSPETNKVFHRWQHIRNWTEETLKNYCELSGFKVTKAETLDLNNYANYSLDAKTIRGKEDFSRKLKIEFKKLIRILIKRNNNTDLVITPKPPHLVVIAQL